jgi:hypothetical protein
MVGRQIQVHFPDDPVERHKQECQSLSKLYLKRWPVLAVAVVVVTAAVLNISHIFVSRSGDKNIIFGAAAENVPVSCSSRNLSAAAAAWTVPCYPLDDSAPAVLDSAALKLLQKRQQHSQLVEDWLQLGNSSMSMLQCTSFSILKVIHQRQSSSNLQHVWAWQSSQCLH